jgi:hypothetical protein
MSVDEDDIVSKYSDDLFLDNIEEISIKTQSKK